MNEIKVLFLRLLEERDWKTLKQKLNFLDHLQIAEIIEESSRADRIILFRLLTREIAKLTACRVSYSAILDN